MSYDAYPWGRWLKWAVAAVLILIVVMSSVSTYNGLVSKDQEVQKTWSQVENVMQERADKINNLVAVVKGYTKHEEKVFGDIAAARSQLMNNNGDIRSKLLADSRINDATREVLLLVENYPNLKADQQYHDLSVAIDEVQNKVAVERKRFIEAVQTYNISIKRFPGSLFAGMMGFAPKDYFKADSGAEKSPDIQF